MTDRPIIEAMSNSINADLMLAHLREFARREKISGTKAELESFEYLKRVLDGYGYRTNLIGHDAYISVPGQARVSALGRDIVSITHSFSQSTSEGGLSGRLVYGGAGRVSDLEGLDVRGNILLCDGIANATASRNATAGGALAQIHISPHEHLHEMCISPVWGSPSEESMGQLPRTVVVSISNANGEFLKQQLQTGRTVDVAVHAQVDTGWRTIPLLTAEFFPPASREDEHETFVMFSGHHDTWHYGVMDNGSANATMLEVARLSIVHRNEWKRGLRLCFWSGHSQGRYSGSAWYADTNWLELEKRCVAHVNVDSTGGKGATVLVDAQSSTELFSVAREAVLRHGGQVLSGLRMTRAGDQSFWGIGIPSMFMGVSEQPAGSSASVTTTASAGLIKEGAGFGWWWHTPQDTIDKIDIAYLVRDTQIYSHAIGRLLGDEILPFDYTTFADHFRSELLKLQAHLGERFSLASALSRVNDLMERVPAFMSTAVGSEHAPAINRAMTMAARCLVPLDYTSGDRFSHDPALPAVSYPVLDPIRRLSGLDPESDGFRLASASARRAVNRVAHSLDEAIASLSI